MLAAGILLIAFVLMAPLRTFGQSERTHSGVSAEELPARLAKARDKHDVPALAVGRIEANRRPDVAIVGVRKRGTDTLPTVDDQWHLGSNTKPFTALLVALLIDRGLLEWDTPLEKIFPEHAEKWSDDLKKVTPAHLLTHTSGLPSNGPLAWFLLIKSQESPLQDRERLVKGLDTVKLNTKPGEKYQYSNLECL
jgi:CubicO group peptidase (beta-lactamase class C family)